jgi:hypothetical protein
MQEHKSYTDTHRRLFMRPAAASMMPPEAERPHLVPARRAGEAYAYRTSAPMRLMRVGPGERRAEARV